MEIPKSHPRYRSLIIREKVVDGFRRGIVVPEGLIAHGRGEAFDYILGEKSWDFAIEAEKATVAWLLTASKPVISVNGNYAALAAREIGELARLTGAIVEVNLFYRTEDRVARIVDFLKQNGVDSVLDADCEKERISGLESPRGIVCRDGIWSADFVLLAMEDGDRTEAIKRMGKIVSAIDLNPFSRTAQTADITIVDEALRATNNMIKMAKTLGKMSKEELENIKKNYDNVEALKASFRVIFSRLNEASRKGLI